MGSESGRGTERRTRELTGNGCQISITGEETRLHLYRLEIIGTGGWRALLGRLACRGGAGTRAGPASEANGMY